MYGNKSLTKTYQAHKNLSKSIIIIIMYKKFQGKVVSFSLMWNKGDLLARNTSFHV